MLTLPLLLCPCLQELADREGTRHTDLPPWNHKGYPYPRDTARASAVDQDTTGPESPALGVYLPPPNLIAHQKMTTMWKSHWEPYQPWGSHMSLCVETSIALIINWTDLRVTGQNHSSLEFIEALRDSYLSIAIRLNTRPHHYKCDGRQPRAWSYAKTTH